MTGHLRAQVHPRPRGRETLLLALGAAALVVGWVGLATTQDGRLSIGDPGLLAVYLGAAMGVHLLFIVTGRRTDQVLLPVVVLLAV